MKVIEVGIVIAIQGNIAKVKASRHNDCDNCGACPGSSAIIIDADNTINAQPGQRVHFVVEQVNMLLAAFIVYIFPLIFTAVAVLIAAYAADINNAVNATQWMIAAGVGSFLTALGLIYLYERLVKRKTSMLPAIVEIVE